MERTLPIRAATDLPDLTVKLGGIEIERPLRGDVLFAEVHEEVGSLARAKLVLGNWKDTENEIKHSDTGTFEPGTEIEIQAGYNGEFESIFDGVITGLKAAFAPGGLPTLTVHCRCRGVLLTGNRKSRVFSETTDKDAVSVIAGDHSLTPQVDDGPTHPQLVQYDASDWAFLDRRARAMGWGLYVRGGDLVMKAPNTAGEALGPITWGATLLEFEVEQELVGRADKVTAAGWDPETLEPVDASSAPASSDAPQGARTSVEKALGGAGWGARSARLPHTAPLDPGELSGAAGAAALRHALGHIHGRGRVQGLHQLRCDSLIALAGLGERFNGNHYVTAVRHMIGPEGYVTEFQVGRPPGLAPDTGDRDRELLPSARNLMLGVVDDIDDANGWGRVKVRLPWLDAEVGGLWARLMRPDAGPKRGFFYIPEVGDEVVVGALEGDPRHLVVLGGVWNGQQEPPETLDAETNPIRAIVSRTGHRVILDDTDGAGMVTLESAAKQTVTIDDSSGSERITLADTSGNTVTLDAGGITLDSTADVTINAPSGAIKLEAGEIKGTSSGATEWNASATLDLNASAVLGITGAMVKINS